MPADGKIVVGTDHTEPFSLDQQDLKAILQACNQVAGWKGGACRFAVAMLTFLRLRPGELMRVSLADIGVRKWTFLKSNPKGQGSYGEVRRLPIPTS